MLNEILKEDEIMKLCFSTLGCPRLDFGDILAIASDLKYSGVEIRGVGNVIDAPDIVQFSTAKYTSTKNSLQKYGIDIAMLTSACYLHKNSWSESDFALAKRYCDTANLMGVKYVRILADECPAPKAEVDDELVANNLKNIANYAKKKDVMVLVETNGSFADTSRLAKLIEGIENVGVIWDIHHPYRFFGETPEQSFANIGKYVQHVHVKDSSKTEDGYKYEMVGEGDVPIKQCVKLLEDSGYDGYYSLEWVKRWNAELEEPGIAFAHYVKVMS